MSTTSARTRREASVTRSPSVVAQRVRGDLVLVHLDTNQIFDLTPSAARLWDLLESPVGPDALVDLLLDEFEVPRDLLAADVERTLESLARHRLVRIDDRE